MSPDHKVVKQVQAALEREPRINLHRYPIGIDFCDGILTLDGELEHVAAKKIALALAAGMGGVRGIVDRLRVAPAVPMGDGAIRDHVRNALVQEPALQRCAIHARTGGQVTTVREPVPDLTGAIEVEVKDGVVTLNGWVRSLAHKRLAGVLAWWVPGSRDVINGLEVEPPQEDNDGEVAEAVRVVLEKDRFANADQMRVRARNSIVTLEGFVSSEEEREMAERDVWYVFGVDKVINRLNVPSRQRRRVAPRPTA